MLLTIFISGLFVFFSTLALVPRVSRLAARWGVMAMPDPRRVHLESTPEAGGLAFGLPIVLAQALLGVFWYDKFGMMLAGLAMAGFCALIFGVLDDRYELKPLLKLGGYLALSLLLYFLGYRVLYITNPFGTEFVLGWLSFPVTIIWFLAIINAINLIDGLDGLAAGITVIVSGVLLVIGYREMNLPVIAVTAMLLMGNLAFLKFNFHPAKIFMGDTGATFIGLNLAAISTAGDAQFKGITSMTLLIPLAALAVPLLDVVLAVFRRIRIGSVFTADKAHIHHTMLSLGLSQKAISIIVYIVTLLFGLIAIGFSFSGKKTLFVVLLGLLISMVVLAYYLMRQELKK